MPSVSLEAFKEELCARFPNLKKHDETRLFTVLMEAGVNVEFEVGKDGATIVTYDPISPESERNLSHA
jgi:hypothetical protein